MRAQVFAGEDTLLQGTTQGSAVKAFRVMLRSDDFLHLLNRAREAARKDDQGAAKTWPGIPISDEDLRFNMWRVTGVAGAGNATFQDFRAKNPAQPGLTWRLVMTEFNTDFTARAARVGMPTGPRNVKDWSWVTMLGHFIDAVTSEQFRRFDLQTDYIGCKLPATYFTGRAGRKGDDDRPFKTPDMVPFLIWIADRPAAVDRCVRHKGGPGASGGSAGSSSAWAAPAVPPPLPWAPAPWWPPSGHGHWHWGQHQ